MHSVCLGRTWTHMASTSSHSGQGGDEVKLQGGSTKTSDRLVKGVFTPHPAFFGRISCPRRVWTLWPQWLFLPWSQLWTTHSELTGLSAQLEPYATVWIRAQAELRTGLCLIQERLLQRHLSCHHQVDCDPMLRAL